MIKQRKNKDFSPIGLMEEIFLENNWTTEKLNEDEIVAVIPGHWDNFALHIIWHDTLSMMYFVCFSEVRFSEPYPQELTSLIFSTNQRSWFGHFDILDSGIICFRYTLPVPSADLIPDHYYQEIVQIIINEFEQFYPAFESLYNNQSVSTMDIDLLALEIAGQA